jgi:hypothetical protein
MRGILGFLTLVAMLVFGMGMITNYKGSVAILNASANGLTKLFTLELGKVPTS